MLDICINGLALIININDAKTSINLSLYNQNNQVKHELVGGLK